MSRRRFGALVLLGVLGLPVVGCGANSPGFSANDGGKPGNRPSTQDGGQQPTLEQDGSVSTTGLVISPANSSITVPAGTTMPTVSFDALLDGKKVGATWSVNQAGLGQISANGTSALFTPSGTAGGLLTITATVKSPPASASTTLAIKLTSTQNGALPTDNPPANSSTIGNGIGGPVDMATQAVLQGAPMADSAFTMLYPYDQTLWPRGLLAPLLQWTQPTQNPTAVAIHLSSQYFDYLGFFSIPPGPAAGSSDAGATSDAGDAGDAGATFVQQPIPQEAWQEATNSVDSTTGSDALTLTVVYAAGGQAFGPVTETWSIAPASLAGTVYYQTYGSFLASPSGATGAILAIRGDTSGPTVVAGANNAVGCSTCHSVAANGESLLVSPGTYSTAVDVDLTQAAYSTTPTGGDLVFAGLTPDGTMAMTTCSYACGPLTPDGTYGGSVNNTQSELVAVPDAGPISTTGFSDLIQAAAAPTFSPDSNLLAFTFVAGPGNPPALPSAGDAGGSQLVVMNFAAATGAFSNPQPVFTADVASGRWPVWPAFLPTDQSLVFDYELNQGSPGPDGGAPLGALDFYPGCYVPGGTACGARSELWWVDLASGKASPLNQLNGKTQNGASVYLPAGPNDHGDNDVTGGGTTGDDSTLNYEPTASPIVSGGYMWVVFTSRRMFGNVATVNPWWSSPAHAPAVTPKKLWVAAIDLNAAPGTDPSHPAFYLPGQEALAGNSRGFWAPDPCKQNGASCQTGDQCCGGYCESTGSGFACGQSTGCSGIQEKCTTASDCCATNAQCINSFCAVPAGPK